MNEKILARGQFNLQLDTVIGDLDLAISHLRPITTGESSDEVLSLFFALCKARSSATEIRDSGATK